LLQSTKRGSTIDPPLFNFLPDHFGVYGNKMIHNLDKKMQLNFSKIIFIIIDTTNWKLSEEVTTSIQILVKKVSMQPFDIYIYNLLKRASYFRARKVTLRNRKSAYSPNSKTYGEQKPMFKENIKIISGLVQLAAYNHNIKCVPLVIRITKRCYTNVMKDRIGPTAQSLGKICIHTLVHNFGEQGKKEVVLLYSKTSLKLIKKQIELESKKTEEETGVSLLSS